MNLIIKKWIKNNCCEDELTCLFCSKVGTVACGIKPAEIISVNKENYLKCIQLKDHINSRIISKSRQNVKVFLYNQESLIGILDNRIILKLLGNLGYPCANGFDAILDELISRLQNNDEFPHEIGLFLGYPIKDVCGYMGLNSLRLTKTMGWQMYGDTADSECIYHERKFYQQKLESLLIRSSA